MRFVCNGLLVGALGLLASETLAATISAGYRGGLLHSNSPSNGLIANIRLVPKLSVAYSYNYAGINVRGAIDNEDLSDNLFTQSNIDVRKAYIRRTFQEAQLRLHPMEGSFYLAFGAIKGSGEGHLVVYEKSSAAHIERKYKFDSSLYSIGIGNLWDKSSIMVGFDWVGSTRKASYEYSVTETISESTGTYVQRAEDDFLDRMETYCGKGGVTGLLFHFGIAL